MTTYGRIPTRAELHKMRGEAPFIVELSEDFRYEFRYNHTKGWRRERLPKRN